jgi:hypothetical protein
MKYKPTGDLKKLVDLGKSNSRVLASVERFVISKPQENDRRTDVLHPSAMAKADWCHRASFFELTGRKPAPSKYGRSLRMDNVFQNGHDMHARWQNYFGEMNRLYGIWECTGCGLREWGLRTDIHVCNDLPPVYREVALKYEPLRIHGHADGWLKGFGDPLLLELKSVGAGTARFEDPDLFYKHDGNPTKIWDNIKNPFYSHIQQAQIYMKLMELLELSDAPQEAIFIYENKGTQEAKEFIMAKSDFSIAPIFEAAQMIIDAIGVDSPPMCNINGIAGCAQCSYHTED